MPAPTTIPTTVSLPNAKWIWSPGATRPYHNLVRFRKTFSPPAVPSASTAQLQITADARYEVHLNGHWLGTGPVRSWKNPWPLDAYDIGHLLKPGENTLEVLVHHPGLSTFQYLHAPAGLLAAIRFGGEAGAVSTDSTWDCAPAESFAWPVPRISCMQPWEEQYDARREATLHWDKAIEVPTDHHTLEPRPIPQLTRTPLPPVRLLAAEIVKPAPYTLSIDPRDALKTSDKSANNIVARLLLVTHIHSDADQEAEFHPPHHRAAIPWKLNGTELKFTERLQLTDTGVARAQLKKGWNILMARMPGREHYWWATLNIWAKDLTFSARPEKCEGPPVLTVGPFQGADRPAHPADYLIEAEHIHESATFEIFNRLWSTGLLTPQDLAAPFVEQAQARMISPVDVYATCASERRVTATNPPGGPPITSGDAGVSPALGSKSPVLALTPSVPQIENPTALLHDTAEWTTIHPSPHGAGGGDVRLLLDFGAETIGHHEFEIDAGPDGAGAIVDNHNFEFIQPDGRFNLAEGMNNAFRYTCRPGVQTYRTLLRRGFRYSWFSFRNLRGPLRIRFIRVLQSTYPQQRGGGFACSDPALDRIWDVGVRSVECCSEDTYTDCPTYEQTFWVGDARNEALVDLVANGDPRLSAHCLTLAARSMDRSALIESQVPSGWHILLPAWSFLWMRWAAEHFTLTGDVSLGKTLLEAIDKNATTVATHRSERGLFNLPGWNMFDWAPMDTPGQGEVTHLQCLAVLALRQCAPMATALGRGDLAKKWTDLASSLATAVNTHLWDDKAQAYIDCIHIDGRRSATFSQQTHTAAHIAAVPTPERAARVRTLMLNEAAPKATPDKFVTAGSPFFMFFLLEAQANENNLEAMLTTIRDYWGIQTEAGATTFWEMYDKNAKWGGRMTRSHCHGWSAAPTYFLSRYILGIHPTKPGFAEVEISPPTTTSLTWARGTIPTPNGPIQIAWQKRPDLTLHLRLDCPPTQKGTLKIGKTTVSFQGPLTQSFPLT